MAVAPTALNIKKASRFIPFSNPMEVRSDSVYRTSIYGELSAISEVLLQYFSSTGEANPTHNEFHRQFRKGGCFFYLRRTKYCRVMYAGPIIHPHHREA